MRKLTIAAVVLAFALASAGMALAIHKDTGGTSPPPKPPANAQQVWKYIKTWNPYKSWPLWPGKGKQFQGREPHGALLTVFVSDDARKVINRKRGTFDDGALVVKENYMPDKTLAAITVMYKVKGYNPDAGDWFWAKYSPEGSVDAAGKVEGCIKCHSANADNDWVFTGPIK